MDDKMKAEIDAMDYEFMLRLERKRRGNEYWTDESGWQVLIGRVGNPAQPDIK